MERAAQSCVQWLSASFSLDTSFIVLCGTGNNGADGLAITRTLHQLGYPVKAFRLEDVAAMGENAAANLERLQRLNEALVASLPNGTFLTEVPHDAVIIDALFGTGINRPLEGWMAAFIQHINHLPNVKIAIDMPSGMPSDSIPDDIAAILKVNHTLSFQFFKRSFLHPETGSLAGEIHVLDIGLDRTFIHATHTNYYLVDINKAQEIFKPRDPFSHKGDHGTALLVGGSYGMIGAMVLSARAALRSGVGKVRCLLPECGYTVMQTAVPEAMCSTAGDRYLSGIADMHAADAIGLGPGMGTASESATALADFLDSYKQPVVIDADALNIISADKKLLTKLPANSIITPHPREFERLFGAAANSMQRLELARTQAMRYNIVIVLKGRYTATVTPDGACWYNTTGNAGLATGGSGDVLTGIITALLAQGYESGNAAILSVYLHGLAANLACAEQSPESLIPTDVTNYLGKAFSSLSAKPEL